MHSLITPLMMHDRELLQRVYRAEQAAAARCAARPRTSAPAARSPESRQRRARAAVPSASAPVRRRAYDVDQPTFYLASSTVDDDGLWHNPASSPSRGGAHRSAELSAGAVSPAGRRGEAATLAGHRVALQRRPWRPSTAGGFRSPPTPPRAANLSDRPRGYPPRSPAVDDVATKIAAVELQRHARGLLARRGGAARAPVAPMAAVVSRRKPR